MDEGSNLFLSFNIVYLEQSNLSESFEYEIPIYRNLSSN